MADTQSRLAEIYKAEKSKGGGIASTLGKRTLEKVDPRQFFNQKGFMAAALPSLFKSYSATPAKSGAKIASAGGGPFSSGVLETKLDILTGETRELKIHSKISAKNSESLPLMARDMNLMRQNITKLVKLQGGTAASRADMFFMKSGERESAYENRFGKEGGKSKTPTQVGAKPEEKKKGIFDSILDFLPTIFKGLLAAGIIGQFLKDPETFKIIKEFATKVLIKFFDGVTATFNLLSELFNNEDVQKSISKAINSIIGAIGDFLSIKLTKLFDTPFGEVNLTIGGAIATVIAGFVAFKVAIATLTRAVLQAAGKIAMGGLPGSAGPAGNPGGKSGRKGRGGWMRGLTGTVGIGLIGEGIQYYLEQGESEEDARKLAQEDINKQNMGLDPEEEIVPSLTKPEGMRGSEIANRATTAAVGASLLKSGLSGLPSTPSTAPSSKVSDPFAKLEGKKLTSGGSVRDGREIEKNKPLWEKIVKVIKKAWEKGVSNAMLSKLYSKFGPKIVAKLSLAIGGIVASGPSVGISLLFTAIGVGMLAKDVFELYEWFVEYEKELDAYEKSLSPTPVAPIIPAVPTPAPYNAAADSQAANPTSTKPTPTPTVPTSAPASNTPTANKTALDITASTEGGGRYDLAFGDKAQKDGTIVNVLGKSKNFPQLAGKIIMTPQDFSGKPLTEMTLSEVKAFQEYKNREAPNTSALGKYGFMGATLFGIPGKPGLVAQLKLPMDTIFNAETQELLQAKMRKGNAAALEQQGVAVTDANLNLANIVGAGGVAKLLKPENANKNALDVLGYARGGDVALTNPGLNKLSKDVVAETYSKYDASGMAPGGSGRPPSGPVVASASAPSGPVVASAATPASLPNFKMPTLGTLAAAAPSMGDMIEAATSEFTGALRLFDSALASITNITNNNTQASAAAQQSQGNLPSVYDDVFLNLFQRVT